MIRVIYTQNIEFRDMFVSLLSLEKKTSLGNNEQLWVYKKKGWICVYANTSDIKTDVSTIMDEYNPDVLYFSFLGKSIDMIHEIGDIILPNVFMHFDEKAIKNPKTNVGAISAKYLSQYEKQEDYYVEDYGLSIGGIVVGNTPDNQDIIPNLMHTYEADAYVSQSLEDVYEMAQQDILSVIIMVGIVSGKSNQHGTGTPMQQVVKNIITTIRLMEDMESTK